MELLTVQFVGWYDIHLSARWPFVWREYRYSVEPFHIRYGHTVFLLGEIMSGEEPTRVWWREFMHHDWVELRPDAQGRYWSQCGVDKTATVKERLRAHRERIERKRRNAHLWKD